ncbi:MAG: S1 RNA-binding domain-containing protein, partial [Verrucomicrobiota bacterium]
METLKPEKQQLDINPEEFTGDDRASLAAMYENTLKNFTEGSIVPGKALEIRKSEVLVDIGYKSEGLIPAEEFKNFSEIKAGDEFEVLIEYLEDEEGMVVLSKQRAEMQKNWDIVVSDNAEGDLIEGEIKARVKGGMIVDIGVDAFLPGSQVDVIPVRYPDDYIGKKFEFKILKINTERRNIVLSRRELLEEKRREQKKTLMSEIDVGQTRKGIVKNITDFGAFIDLNGMDGLLHITDMSWGRINHPSEMLQLGQELDVIILEIDRDKDRISLGLKQKTENPWERIDEKFPLHSRVHGKVVNLMPYGAFIELEEGVEGMVHVSEISWTKRVARASDVLTVGEMVDAVVLAI